MILWALVFGGFIAFSHIQNAVRFDTLVKNRARDQKAMTENVIAAEGKNFASMISHYGELDDSCRCFTAGDKAWAKNNIADDMAEHGVDAILLYKSDGSLFYSASKVNNSLFKGLPMGKDDVVRLFAEKPLLHFFMVGGSTLVEVRGTSIVPEADKEHKSPAQGYLFVLRLWDDKYIGYLGELTGSRWRKANYILEHNREYYFDRKKGDILFFYDLRDWSGSVVGCYEVSSFVGGLWWLSQSLNKGVWFYFVFAAVSLGGLFYIFLIWVFKPVNAIALALKRRDLVLARKLKANGAEFGDIGKAIEQYLVHGAQLSTDSQRTANFQKTLLKIIQMEQTGSLSVQILLEHCAKGLDVERVGAWLFQEGNMVGIDMYRSPEDIHEKGVVLKLLDFPLVLKTVTESRAMVVIGEHNEALAKAFNLEHLEKFHITSFAVVAIRCSGKVVGLLTASYTRSPVPEWSAADKDFAASMADMLSLKLESTERERVEGKLKEAYDQLKAMQSQLVQSAKMASLGTLSGGIAHEINNPLSGILNNVQLVKIMAKEKKDFDVNDFKELLASIEESAVRCRDVVVSLLEFAHSPKSNFANLALNSVVEKVVTIMNYELHTGNITIGKELAQNLPLVKGNAQLLQQVVFDVVANAHWAINKKEKKGDGLIYIRTFYDAASRRVALFISDTGCGISQANLPKIFEPFFTTKELGEGAGLGLSIVYNIVKEHHGTIEAESQINQGTTIKIYFPAG